MSKLHTILTVLVAVIVVGTVAIPIINQYTSGNVEYETVVTDRENTGQAFYMSPSTGSYTLKSDGTAPDMWAVSDSFALNVDGGVISLTTADKKLSDLIETDTGGGEISLKKVVASQYTTFYITTSGDLYGAGDNSEGQQGNGSTADVTTFTKIASSVADVSASQNTTFYITTSGDLYGAGGNSDGQQGNGSTGNVTTFTKIASSVADVSSPQSTTFYITTSGDLYGAGDNSDGQQGNGSTDDVTTFTKIGSTGAEPVDLTYTVTIGAGRVTLVQTEQTLLDVPYTVLYVNSTTGDYAAYLPTSSTPVYADKDSDIYLMGTASWADGSPSGVSGSAGSKITASDYKGARQITAASPSGSYVVAPVGYTTTEQVAIGDVEASPMVKTMFGLLPVLMLVAVLLGITRAYRQ